MKLVTGAQMREIDRRAREEFGLPELVFMENAGVQVARSVQKWLQKSRKNRVLILAGSGNNGGDGLVAARHLLNIGAEVRVLFVVPREKLNEACRTQLMALEKMGTEVAFWDTVQKQYGVQDWLRETDLVIDGMYGTGFHGELPETAAWLSEQLQKERCCVVAIDIPSGVDADTGKASKSAVRADITITLALPKPGLFLGQGAECAGRVKVSAIGMPFSLVQDAGLLWNFTELQEVERWLPVRKPNSHKGTYGHVIVIGGSGGMIGAVRMASRAALKTGAGCVTAVIPASMQTAIQTAEMEIMTYAVQETSRQQLTVGAMEEISSFALMDKRKNAYVLGPGMGRYPEAGDFVRALLKVVSKPMVIDADALMALAGQTELLSGVQAPLILTPHPGEMAALTGLSIEEIEQNRIAVALHYARAWNVIVVLKGHHTLIASPQGELWMNSCGNAGMATAGSGDVLSGITAGLLAQGLEPLKAAVAAVYLHGAAGDRMAKKVGQSGLVAGDLLEGVPLVMRDFMKVGKSSEKKQDF